MKKAAIYARVSTPDQHVETQLYDLRKMAAQRALRSFVNTATGECQARRRGVRGWTP